MHDIRIERADSAAGVGVIRELFAEYAQSLGFDLGYQGFSSELALLPGAYAPPRGVLLIASVDGEHAGCVGVRPLDATTCEMKRLYVRPRFRRHQLGRRLVRAAIDASRAAGYAHMKLDTLATMLPARTLYEAEGFRETAPYSANYLSGTCFYVCDLEQPSRAS